MPGSPADELVFDEPVFDEPEIEVSECVKNKVSHADDESELWGMTAGL